VRKQQGSGGRKEPWDSTTRQEVMRRAKKVGAEKAGAAFGVPSGTVRSWLKRAAVKAADDDDVEARLAEVQRQGRLIVEERERQLADPEYAARAERERLAMIARIEAGSRRESGVESPKPKKRKRGRRGGRKRSQGTSSPVGGSGAGGTAASAAQRQLDGSDELPPYRLVREDGSVREVPANDREVGPYARRQR
jgi:hypothetical protein